MSEPTFSILICTVGKEELTRGAIRSILDQNYNEVEIIVTDTSGSDKIKSIADSFNDPRIRFFAVPNQDPTISWEFAYEQSRGKYVLWYDDDNRLVPWALAHVAKIITEQGADIVSGNHTYYFGTGNRHRPEQDNALSALFPFSCQTTIYERDFLLRMVYDFSMGAPSMPRWHSAATFVSRNICEDARATTGYVIAPHMYGNFTFHPIIFSFAKRPLYDDRPLCIIGKFASSITQQWSNSFVKASRSTALPFKFTGVSERTLGNTTAECYLRVRNDIPSHEAYFFNWEKVYIRYSSELLLLKIPLIRHLRAWIELWRASRKLDAQARTRVRARILKQGVQSMILQALRALGLWEFVRQHSQYLLTENRNRRIVPLSRYDIYSIDDCAKRLDEIFKAEWGLAIKTND